MSTTRLIGIILVVAGLLGIVQQVLSTIDYAGRNPLWAAQNPQYLLRGLIGWIVAMVVVMLVGIVMVIV